MVRAPIAALIEAALARAAAQHGWDLPAPPAYLIEAPKDPAQGDAASNLALSLAKPLGLPPVRIAEAIAEALPAEPAIADISVAPPGFLNFRLRHGFLIEALGRQPDADLALKLRALAADHVHEAIAAGRVPPGWATWSELDRAGLCFHVLARPNERIEAADIRRETLDNPWFYVRQARDRMASVLATAEAEGLSPALMDGCLKAAEERQLLVLIAGLEGEQQLALERRQPQRLVRAAVELASGFHRFYTACRIFGEARQVAEARLAMVEGARIALSAMLASLECPL